MKYRGIFASSSDPAQLSRTVDGLIVVLSAIIPGLALQYFHVTVSAQDVASFVTEAASLVGVIMAIRGTFLKVINTFARN